MYQKFQVGYCVSSHTLRSRHLDTLVCVALRAAFEQVDSAIANTDKAAARQQKLPKS